ncbi:hypothetical protein ACTGYK_00910 [Streptococcus suis]|uniref:hypothetical protein n=1 Tax=Streptococcus suis TaxID=1307 RepID=UPI001C946ED1|nr:hypothetical protein [Streptococcus suis]MBY4959025.1 hypothetical protein [Streptococcus suis]
MSNETKMLATMILEIVETTKKWVSRPENNTVELVDGYIESNKVYEIKTDENGDTTKVFAGIKDEQLDCILKHLRTSLDRDKKDVARYTSEISSKGEHQLKLIENIVKHYADINTEE